MFLSRRLQRNYVLFSRKTAPLNLRGGNQNVVIIIGLYLRKMLIEFYGKIIIMI